jgi:two-component system CheB/CheR fusion protein
MKRKAPQSSARSPKVESGGSQRAAQAQARQDVEPGLSLPFAIVGIGGSAGGLEAFTALLKHLPADTGMAFVFVQHLAPAHTSLLAEILQRATSMRVTEVHDEPRVEPNCVYVIPPARTMIVTEGRLSLTPRRTGEHHPIDQFFTSLAADQGHRAIGVVLSGTASDGTAGLAAIKAVGGITFAQDATAHHDGMPRSAIAAGCVDLVLPPSGIAQEISRLAQDPYVVQPGAEVNANEDIDQVLTLVRQGSGVDFSQYKSNTLHRRIRRRMVLQKIVKLEEYADYLRSNPQEIEALYQDILINVTNFFRNPEAFEVLKAKVFPRLFKDRARQDPVRVWVLGCSTGEEPYSLAIALSEYAAEIKSGVPIVVYATDLNNLAIDKSRNGLYPKRSALDISPERLRRFFVEADGGYRVAKSIRDMCIFARHNVLTDPPFSRMDLISCRNVMIYMEPELQRKLLPLLHYALKPSGFLFLGPSETIGASRELFEAEDTRHKVYSRKAGSRRLDHSFAVGTYTSLLVDRRPQDWREMSRDTLADIQREADRALLARYVPAGVLVDANQEVLQFRGDTGMYFTPAPGKASLNVLKMAREGLLVSLRSCLQRARREDAPVHEEGVRVKSNGGYHDITLSVIPIGRPDNKDRCYWILFENSSPVPAVAPRAGARRKKDIVSAEQSRELEEKDRQISRVTQELAATREYLQSVIEQQEAANEELQSANEEVQSANEELQSINEELETSKEEIQSSNEELTTVNEELHNRNDELNRANNDLNNLFGSVQMAIVMVWPDLRIRRFTAIAEKLFNLIATDVGRPLGDIKLNLDLDDLPQLLTEVIDSITAKELEVQDMHGRWYLLRIRPYRTMDNKIDGAVIVLIDIDTLKQSQGVLERQARLLEQTHEAVFVRELDGPIVYWNRGAELLYGFGKDEAKGHMTHELLGTTASTQATLNEALERNGRWMGELVHRTKDGREIVVDSIQVVLKEADRHLVLETNRDVTERRRLEESLRGRVEELAEADRHKDEFLAMLAHELRNPLAPLRNAIEILKSAGTNEETTRRAHELIDRQVYTLTRLVEDLLDAARINRGQIQLQREPVELQKVLGQAIETTRQVIDERQHRLSVVMPPSPVLLEGDITRLEQVFSNLLHNSAKYTPEGGDISVIAELLQPQAQSGGEVAVRVRDTGIGIEKEMLPRVFELFTQADRSLARTQGGLGIGLSLVRSLVELHGGRATARSDGPGRGSEFTVYLPLASQTSQSERAHRTEKPTSSRTPPQDAAAVRVLVVDDSRDIAESMSVLLSLSGNIVKTASSGEEALDIATEFHPNAVLLDIGMPGLDGYEVARSMRRQPALKDVLLVAVTGYGGQEFRKRATQAGFDYCLTKPVEPSAVVELLRDRERAPLAATAACNATSASAAATASPVA